MDIEKERERFEAWISAPPFEYMVNRYTAYSGPWPSQYRDLKIQLAWEAWQEALREGE